VDAERLQPSPSPLCRSRLAALRTGSAQARPADRIVLVGATSLLVALAPRAVVVAARTIQGAEPGRPGLGSGGAGPLHRGTAPSAGFGILGASFGSGLAIGPLAAGALVQATGWRSVFLLVAAISWPPWCLRPGPRNPATGPAALDPAGLVTFTAGLACLSFGFVRAGAVGWTAPSTLLLLAAAVALVALFAAVEIR